MSIDYGYGLTNINHETGIRYGVISQRDVVEAWGDAVAIFPCDACDCEKDENGELIDGRNCDAEPIGWEYDHGGYHAMDCLDSDVIVVIRSPFYTHAPLCSPCLPGAGNLNGATDDSTFEAYCFGHDWFPSGVAPYRVFGVITHRRCFPDQWYGG